MKQIKATARSAHVDQDEVRRSQCSLSGFSLLTPVRFSRLPRSAGLRPSHLQTCSW